MQTVILKTFGDLALLIHRNHFSLLNYKHYGQGHIPIFHCTYELHMSHGYDIQVFISPLVLLQSVSHSRVWAHGALWAVQTVNPFMAPLYYWAVYIWCVMDKYRWFFWTCWPHLILLHVVHTRVEHRAQVSQVEYCQSAECNVNHIHPQRLHRERRAINISDIFNSFLFHCNTLGFSPEAQEAYFAFLSASTHSVTFYDQTLLHIQPWIFSIMETHIFGGPRRITASNVMGMIVTFHAGCFFLPLIVIHPSGCSWYVWPI